MTPLKSCAILNFDMFLNGKKSAGFTLTEVAVVFLIIVITILLLTPFINKIRSNAKVIACKENLQDIGFALNLYASEHQGKFPSDLAELSENDYVEDERVFDCPSSPQLGDAQEPDYHYVTGYTVTSPSDTPIVFDKTANHKDGRHVLYISGDVLWKEKHGAMAE